MTQNTLVVGHGNVHNRPAAMRRAMRMGCDVFGFNEAGRGRAFFATRKRHRLHQAQPVVERNGRDVSGDCATLVRKRLPYLGEWQQQVSQRVGAAPRVAPDRWFLVSCFAFNGQRVAHLNLHPNAGPALRSKPNSPVTVEYADSMRWLDAMLGVYRARGYALVVGGDFNLPDLTDDPPWSPWPVLTRHGLDWHRRHIDAIAWSRKHFRPGAFSWLDRDEFGSDHPALRMELVAR